MSVEDSGHECGGQWSCVWRTVVVSVEDSGRVCGGQWS